MNKKKRLDLSMVERGIENSRERAKALIMAGEVMVNSQIILKADYKVKEEDIIELKQKFPYASRAALKLKTAIEKFKINTKGISVIDIGISNGGFSDYLLQNGAEKIIGIDVNIVQVNEKLKNSDKVELIKMNARYLKREDINMEPDLIVMDLSFISILKILPNLKDFKNSLILSLIKPQFESTKKEITRGGVIRDKKKILKILLRLKKSIEELGFGIIDFCKSETKGKKGNQEYFFLMKYGNNTLINDKIIENGI